MIKISKLLPFMFLILSIPFILQVNAETGVTKAKLPYEVISISIEGEYVHISGWAFIAYTQHFENSSDHGVSLDFVSSTHQFRVNALITPISQTKTMEYFGSPICANNIYNQIPEICNYRYENVGFDVYVLISSFKDNENYQTNINVNAYLSQQNYSTPLYYPLANDLTIQSKTKEIKIISRLDDTVLTVSATTVLARKEPYKTAPTYFVGLSCSTTYLNQLFFLVNTTYRNVFEKTYSEDTSYYRVSANTFICSANRRRIVEGSSISPVWIASPYVLYSGSPLQIQVRSINQTPVITVNHTEIYEGYEFNYLNYVSASDYEEGDISSRISLIDTNFTSQIGLYFFNVKVCDLQNLCTTNRLYVNVKEIPNNIPVIYADDVELLINSVFNGYQQASAYDVEDGDLTSMIQVISSIDTSILGTQSLCFQVIDSKNAIAHKCINVTVIDYSSYLNKFRFISNYFLFYNEEIPELWLNKMDNLRALLNSESNLTTIVLE